MAESQPRPRQLGLLWGAVAVAVVLTASSAEQLAQNLPHCTFKALLGIPCPTCGVTRAALALARLDLVSAFRVNPLATLAWMALVPGGLAAGVSTLAGRPPKEPRWNWRPVERLGLVLVVVANWAYLVARGL